MSFTKKNQIREFVDMNISEEFFKELEKKVEDIIVKAQERAKANQRRTLFGRDL